MKQIIRYSLAIILFCTSTTEISNSKLQADPFNEAPALQEIEAAIAALHPETDLEREVISSEEWLAGARFGKPRNGHPEGAVIFHIHEVLGNVENYYSGSPLREKLRIIALIHDTFKHKVDPSLPKVGENQHGMIARRFAENYISDPGILEIIQRHDDAYFAWKLGAEAGDWESAYESACQLIDILGKDLELYLAFFECDNRTGDKTPESLDWFRDIAQTYQD